MPARPLVKADYKKSKMLESRQDAVMRSEMCLDATEQRSWLATVFRQRCYPILPHNYFWDFHRVRAFHLEV
jgi:hypothetical protein